MQLPQQLTTIPPHRIAMGIAILLIAITLINGILFFIPSREDATEVSDIKSNTSFTTQASLQLVQAIPQWHLFGEAPVTADNLAQTRLELVLNGVMLNRQIEGTYAIIAESGKEQKLYHVGDNLPGGAKLYQIGPHSVVIQYNGKLEQLPIQKSQSQ